MLEKTKQDVLDGWGTGRPYHTGEHDPELVNRDDVMRMLLVQEILRRMLKDVGLTVDVSDYQMDPEEEGDEAIDTLVVYATATNGDQAYCDIRAATPEEQALFLFDELGRY